MEQPGVDKQHNLDVFVSDLLAKKGLEDNSEAHTRLLKQVNKKINTTLLAMLPIWSLDYLEFCVNDGVLEDQHIEKVIADAGIDVNEVVDVTLKRFEDEYLKGDK